MLMRWNNNATNPCSLHVSIVVKHARILFSFNHFHWLSVIRCKIQTEKTNKCVKRAGEVLCFLFGGRVRVL